jgi:hypothetical protein
MSRTRLLALAAALLIICVAGSTLTRDSHGAANVLSNIFFFTLVVLVLGFAVAAVAAGINRVRARRVPSSAGER